MKTSSAASAATAVRGPLCSVTVMLLLLLLLELGLVSVSSAFTEPPPLCVVRRRASSSSSFSFTTEYASTRSIRTLSSSSSFSYSSKHTFLHVTTKNNNNNNNGPVVFDDVCETVGVTLKRFMAEVAILNPELSEMATLFGAIDTSCKAISNLVRRSQLPSPSETLGLNYDAQGGMIHGGEEQQQQKQLDIITNDLLKRALRFTGRLGVLASEEEDTPIDLMDREKEVIFSETERYVAVFDPLDGSSNIDAGIPTGTIIGIYAYDESCAIDPDCLGEECTEQEAQCLANTLQPGTQLVASAYCLYSSSTFLVLTLGSGTYGFTLDTDLGEFVLSRPNIQIPQTSSIMSFNEANSGMWDPPLQEVTSRWRTGMGISGKEFTSRYIGSFVADVHRTLLYGGVFGYPGDTKNPNGKLHLLYEGAPMSFIMEQAGGLATTGKQRVMEISPTTVHQRVPIIMGSKNDVQEIIDAYNDDAAAATSEPSS